MTQPVLRTSFPRARSSTARSMGWPRCARRLSRKVSSFGRYGFSASPPTCSSLPMVSTTHDTRPGSLSRSPGSSTLRMAGRYGLVSRSEDSTRWPSSRQLCSRERASAPHCMSVSRPMSVLRSDGMTCAGLRSASRPMTRIAAARMTNFSSLSATNSAWRFSAWARKSSKRGLRLWMTVSRMRNMGSTMPTVSSCSSTRYTIAR
mmetsp:Transcript_14032/g.27594  ORF Transcript_14032/g.27594 Transcript_14032/m.27594 type:complete len:204 (-) Transcript_14032:228-839(-)